MERRATRATGRLSQVLPLLLLLLAWPAEPARARGQEPPGELPFRRFSLPPEVGWPAQDLTRDAQGRAWLTTPRGLFLVPEEGACCQPVDDWGGESPRALWAASSGELYLAALGALYQRNPQGRWQRWSEAEGLPREQLTGVAKDGEGRVWVWGAHGTFVLRPGARAFAPGPEVGGEQLALPTAVDGQGRLWWATNRGLFRKEVESARPVQAHGLPEMWLSHVYVDREGSLWVAGGAGLFRLLGRGLWLRHGQRQGLPSDTLWAIHRDGSGHSSGRAPSEAWRGPPRRAGRRCSRSETRRCAGSSPPGWQSWARSGRIWRCSSPAWRPAVCSPSTRACRASSRT